MLSNPDTDKPVPIPPNQSDPILPQSRTRLVDLLENVQTALFRYHLQPSPGYDYLSPAITRLTGFSLEEYQSDPLLAVLSTHPEDRGLLAELFEGLPPTENPLVVRTYRKDGETAWLEYLAVIVPDDLGEPIAIEGLIRDITHQKQVELALLESQAQLSSIIDTAVDAIIVLNPDQEIIIFNHAAEGMFGYTADQVLGQLLDRLIPVQARPFHRDQVQSFGVTGLSAYRMGATRVTTGIRANGTEFPIEASISVFTAGAHRFYTAIVRDITERKQSEENLVHLSTHDPLTSLYNRAFFEAELDRLEKRRPSPLTMVIADLDGLKYVNDVYGHSSGDDLLRDVAKILKAAFRAEDIVARLGGDEFGVLLPNADATMTATMIQRIRSRLAAYNRLNRKVPINLSIGVATADEHEPLTDVLKRADLSMYVEKRTKGGLRRALSSQ
jgi:diguanylate cyclase (GGDEF)-like protein/PAS domain S-box-containing protein